MKKHYLILVVFSLLIFEMSNALSKVNLESVSSILAIELDSTELKNPKYFLVHHKCKESVWHTWSQGKNIKNIDVMVKTEYHIILLQ